MNINFKSPFKSRLSIFDRKHLSRFMTDCLRRKMRITMTSSFFFLYLFKTLNPTNKHIFITLKMSLFFPLKTKFKMNEKYDELC